MLSVKKIVEISNGSLYSGDENLIVSNFSKDTRTLSEGDVYVGIKGEKFNGNVFWNEAFDKGAILCILEKDTVLDNVPEDKTIILVEDSVDALQKIAKYHLKQKDPIVIALTGSVGKTSTKEMIYSVLKQSYSILKTEGNYNNHIGLPLTILKLSDEEVLLLEMGMNHAGEISVLSKIAEPDIALVISIADAHIGNLGSMENILKAKLEIVDGLKEDGTLIINNDNEYLHNAKINLPSIIKYGIKNDSDLKAIQVKFCEDYCNLKVRYENEEYEFNPKIITEGFVYNALASIMIGIKMDMSIENIKKGIENFELVSGRLEKVETKKGINLINDAYNANAESMKNALEYISNLTGNRRIAILGNMLEQGDFDERNHRQVGEYVTTNNIDYLITIGDSAKFINESAIQNGMDENKTKHFNANKDSFEFLKELLVSDDLVIVKASNGEKFIEIVNFIKDM